MVGLTMSAQRSLLLMFVSYQHKDAWSTPAATGPNAPLSMHVCDVMRIACSQISCKRRLEYSGFDRTRGPAGGPWCSVQLGAFARALCMHCAIRYATMNLLGIKSLWSFPCYPLMPTCVCVCPLIPPKGHHQVETQMLEPHTAVSMVIKDLIVGMHIPPNVFPQPLPTSD